MNYKIAIPSYRREQTIQDKSLAYLKRCGKREEDVDVFVSDESQLRSYKATGIKCNLIVGVPTIMKQRNFMMDYYPEGTKVLFLDDDIKSVYRRVSSKKVVEENDLDWLCENGFQFAHSAGSKMWGINPVLNPFYMSEKPSTSLKYIVACFYGCIIDHSEDLKVTLDDKEDYERSILYYLKFGSTPRLNNYAPDTNYYTEPGGLQVSRTPERIEESAKNLLRRFPLLCSWNNSKKSEHAEVRLKDRRKKR